MPRPKRRQTSQKQDEIWQLLGLTDEMKQRDRNSRKPGEDRYGKLIAWLFVILFWAVILAVSYLF